MAVIPCRTTTSIARTQGTPKVRSVYLLPAGLATVARPCANNDQASSEGNGITASSAPAGAVSNFANAGTAMIALHRGRVGNASVFGLITIGTLLKCHKKVLFWSAKYKSFAKRSVYTILILQENKQTYKNCLLEDEVILSSVYDCFYPQHFLKIVKDLKILFSPYSRMGRAAFILYYFLPGT